MKLDVVFSVEPGLLDFLKKSVFGPGVLERIERKLDTMSQEIDALKTNFDARMSEIHASLENISQDIATLKSQGGLSQEAKDKLSAIGASIDSLAVATKGVA